MRLKIPPSLVDISQVIVFFQSQVRSHVFISDAFTCCPTVSEIRESVFWAHIGILEIFPPIRKMIICQLMFHTAMLATILIVHATGRWPEKRTLDCVWHGLDVLHCLANAHEFLHLDDCHYSTNYTFWQGSFVGRRHHNIRRNRLPLLSRAS